MQLTEGFILLGKGPVIKKPMPHDVVELLVLTLQDLWAWFEKRETDEERQISQVINAVLEHTKEI